MIFQKRSIWEENEAFLPRGEFLPGFLFTADIDYGGKTVFPDQLDVRAKEKAEKIVTALSEKANAEILKDETYVQQFFGLHPEYLIPGPFLLEYYGFKVYAEEHVFYFVFEKKNEKYACSCLAYNRTLLNQYFAHTYGMPVYCYGTLYPTGQRTVIRYLDSDVEVLPQYGNDLTVNSAYAREQNEEIEVSEAQQKAMENGAYYGWDTPVAHPEYHKNKQGPAGGSTIRIREHTRRRNSNG